MVSSPNSSALLCCVFSAVPFLFSPSSPSYSFSLLPYQISIIAYTIVSSIFVMTDSVRTITYISFAIAILSVSRLSWSLHINHCMQEELRECFNYTTGNVQILTTATRALANRVAEEDIENQAALVTMERVLTEAV